MIAPGALSVKQPFNPSESLIEVRSLPFCRLHLPPHRKACHYLIEKAGSQVYLPKKVMLLRSSVTTATAEDHDVLRLELHFEVLSS
ncbi:hypothetical protein SAMN02745166_00939 [Prosthecobacter debontii]|uniref:Uncharacterized protein n=1 Tax=Prosthecobacter debontii TaxID=48467 RepID=A0A1T4X188_9BACT|nr:hypothetical protein SAMN02745166_00939 [Prosthecobacter debontii]